METMTLREFIRRYDQAGGPNVGIISDFRVIALIMEEVELVSESIMVTLDGPLVGGIITSRWIPKSPQPCDV